MQDEIFWTSTSVLSLMLSGIQLGHNKKHGGLITVLVLVFSVTTIVLASLLLFAIISLDNISSNMSDFTIFRLYYEKFYEIFPEKLHNRDKLISSFIVTLYFSISLFIIHVLEFCICIFSNKKKDASEILEFFKRLEDAEEKRRTVYGYIFLIIGSFAALVPVIF